MADDDAPNAPAPAAPAPSAPASGALAPGAPAPAPAPSPAPAPAAGAAPPRAPASFMEAFGHVQHAPGFAATRPAPPPPHPPAAAPSPAPAPHASSGAAHVSAALAHARAKTVMLASVRQRGNPMLAHVRHVRVEFDGGIAADFVCGATTAVLYLSLQYHRGSGGYVYERVRGLGRGYRLRVLLVLADVEDGRGALRELAKLALATDMTLVVCGSEREAARYCETLRCYDAKTADSIQERVAADYPSQLRAALTSVRGVNKTDVSTLAFTFGSLSSVARATREELRTCPGMGERKVARLYAAMNQPFKASEPWSGSGAAEDDDQD